MRFVNFVLLLIVNVTASFSSNATSFSNNTIPKTPKIVSNNSSMVQPSQGPEYTEGGPITIDNRKETNFLNKSVTEKALLEQSPSASPPPPQLSSSTNALPTTVAPHNEKKIFARKGANYSQLSEEPSSFLPTDTLPMKPTVTVGNDERSPPQPDVKQQHNLSFKGLLMESDAVKNSQKYTVPIVIVILSVPFVAMLFSFVYKRGSEWWRYRHYRRMDFLINGIYDN